MSKQLFESLIQEISSGNIDSVEDKIAELSEEQIDALFGEAQPFKALGTASSEKIVIGSVSNLREKYLKKLVTTSMVSFLFQMKDEFTVDEEDLTTPVNKDDFFDEIPAQTLPENFNMDNLYNEELLAFFTTKFPESNEIVYKEMEKELTEDDLLEVSNNVSKRYADMTRPEKVINGAKYDEALEAAIQKQSESEKVVINRFLEWLFKFNADKHSEGGGQAVVDDPERKDVAQLKGTDPVYDNIPPNDTHCRFNAYADINYEKLRDATHNIYNIKPDLEHAMIVYNVVDTQAEVDSFIHKYGSTSKYDIVAFPLNRWTLMGPFKENRERVDYYNKHNSIIKSMLEQAEKDAALGEDLMKKRVKNKKVKAEKVFGKDSPQFEEYKKLNPSEVETKYNGKVEEIEDGIKVTRDVVIDAQTGEEVKDEGVPLNALEIPITSINAKTGATTQTRIFTQSDD